MRLCPFGKRNAGVRTAAALGVSIAKSSVGTSAATVPDDGTTTVTITVAVLDIYAAPLNGIACSAVATGSGNTIGSIANTNAFGVTTFTFATTGATAHVITVTAGGLALAHVTVTGVSSQVADATTTTITADVSTITEGAVCNLTIQAKQAGGANKTIGGDTVTVSKSGGTATGTLSSVTDNGNGTYSATYTGLTAGTAQTLGGTINAVTISGGANPTCAVTAAVTYTTPDNVNNASFESGWDGFQNGSGGTPTGSTTAYDPTGDPGGIVPPSGTKCIHRVWAVSSPSDQGGHIAWNFGHSSGTGCVDRLWWRYYFHVSALPSTAHKFCHVMDSTSYTAQWGGLYLSGVGGKYLHWLWTRVENNKFYRLVPEASMTDGWHSIEVDYWHRGDEEAGGAAGVGYPSIAFWWDNVQVINPYGTPSGSTGVWMPSGRLNLSQRPGASETRHHRQDRRVRRLPRRAECEQHRRGLVQHRQVLDLDAGQDRSVMAITRTALAISSSTTDANSYATASQTPTASTLVTAVIISIKATAPDIPTITGNSLTWVQRATHIWNNGTNEYARITTFRAAGAAAAGVATIDFGGVTQLACGWGFSEWPGADASGTNGSGGFPQTPVKNQAGSGTAISATLAALAGADSAAWATCCFEGNPTLTVGTGFTGFSTLALSDGGVLGKTGSEWKINETAITATLGASQAWCVIADEIKAAASSGLAKIVGPGGVVNASLICGPGGLVG